MNRIVLVGRLARDPEMKVLEERGKVMTRIVLAVDRPFKGADGEREADFIPVVLWGRRAEVVAEYMTKGMMVSVCGRLQTKNYEDREGKRRYLSEVVADEFQFVEGKKTEEAAI
jgi:single-strand DNA-binding protein